MARGSSTPQAATESSGASALVDEIAAQIRTKIMSGEIPIGAQLRQAVLADTFGVSRTPIREALRQLQSGGLIEVNPNRGAVVRVPAPWDVREVYEVRAELEGLAAARAAGRLSQEELETLREANQLMYQKSIASAEGDLDTLAGPHEGNELFHTLITRASGNSHLAKAISDINQSFPRNVSALLLANDSRHRDKNFEEHERIVAALEAGDADEAREAMRQHVFAAGEHLARWYEERSSTVFRGEGSG